ncbi:hypothetical protein GCM10022380_05470 [Amycolatopsis tucumanensis]|uniref:Uncharacterized protein n=1 Tax=Amycolatopsis tucumanensis TaxID=401106 RepID=A0ABP7HGL4_9PSEU
MPPGPVTADTVRGEAALFPELPEGVHEACGAVTEGEVGAHHHRLGTQPLDQRPLDELGR